MARNVKPELLVEIDLNSPSFQSTWNDLEQIEQEKAIATFEKLTQLTWNQVYKDKGLRWEKIHSIQAPQGHLGRGEGIAVQAIALIRKS